MTEPKDNTTWVPSKWCVLQNKKTFKVIVHPGRKSYTNARQKILFESDDMKECEAFRDNYSDEDDEELIGYTCDECGHFQADPASCDICDHKHMSPIWD